ncbi:hypothetical protein J6590_083988 [Homalodisca vitripennis]|nr:hypothetical protein J6590_083988 [Homalodisca vitripennis]
MTGRAGCWSGQGAERLGWQPQVWQCLATDNSDNRAHPTTDNAQCSAGSAATHAKSSTNPHPPTPFRFELAVKQIKCNISEMGKRSSFFRLLDEFSTSLAASC